MTSPRAPEPDVRLDEMPLLFRMLDQQAIRRGEPPIFSPDPRRPARPRRGPRIARRPLGRWSARLALVAVLALVVAAGALARYTSTGHGSANAIVGAPREAIVLSAGATTTALYPGQTADVSISIENPNPAGVHIPSLVLDTGRGTNGFAVDSADCDLSAIHFTATPADNGGAGWDAPHGSSSIDLPAAISMDANAASACQGAAFTVYLQVVTG